MRAFKPLEKSDEKAFNDGYAWGNVDASGHWSFAYKGRYDDKYDIWIEGYLLARQDAFGD